RTQPLAIAAEGEALCKERRPKIGGGKWIPTNQAIVDHALSRSREEVQIVRLTRMRQGEHVIKGNATSGQLSNVGSVGSVPDNLCQRAILFYDDHNVVVARRKSLTAQGHHDWRYCHYQIKAAGFHQSTARSPA